MASMVSSTNWTTAITSRPSMRCGHAIKSYRVKHVSSCTDIVWQNGYCSCDRVYMMIQSGNAHSTTICTTTVSASSTYQRFDSAAR